MSDDELRAAAEELVRAWKRVKDLPDPVVNGERVPKGGGVTLEFATRIADAYLAADGQLADLANALTEMREASRCVDCGGSICPPMRCRACLEKANAYWAHRGDDERTQAAVKDMFDVGLSADRLLTERDAAHATLERVRAYAKEHCDHHHSGDSTH